MKDVLQGKPLGHPLHTILVHLPISMFYISFLFDLANLLPRQNQGTFLPAAAFYTMGLGILGALLASIPGFADYSSIRRDHPARKLATRHMLLNLIAVGLYAFNWYLRQRTPGTVETLPLVLSFIGVSAISYSGYLGGKMIYEDGVSVGRHRRPGPTPTETRTLTPGADGYYLAGNLEDLAEGQSLRLSLDGTIVAVARHGGQVYAFQEFCTHRHGPLSEGCFKDGVVTCPWHNSQFNMRSGKCVAKPAKKDLKTFEVQLRGNLILIRDSSPASPQHPTRPTGVNPGTPQRDWRHPEEADARRRMEPRVDADGKTMQ